MQHTSVTILTYCPTSVRTSTCLSQHQSSLTRRPGHIHASLPNHHSPSTKLDSGESLVLASATGFCLRAPLHCKATTAIATCPIGCAFTAAQVGRKRLVLRSCCSYEPHSHSRLSYHFVLRTHIFSSSCTLTLPPCAVTQTSSTFFSSHSQA